MLYDSHCHLDWVDAAGIERAANAGVTRVLVPGVDRTQWAACEANHFERIQVRRAVGIHPRAAHEVSVDEVPGWIKRLDAAAVGEFGWDRRVPATVEQQDELADGHLELARARDLPVVLHVVAMHGHALGRLERHGSLRAGGVVHGYSGSAELVGRYVALGLSVSIGPSVLRDNARRPLEAARAIPEKRLLVETDAPDQGEPADLRLILERVADVRGVSLGSLGELTHNNAKRLFG